MLRSSSCLPKLTTVRAVMVRAAMEKKKSKDVVTKVAPVQGQDPTVQISLLTKDGSFIASVSAEENVGYL